MYIPTALSYDDVLLVPKKSDIKSRHDVTTNTKLTRNISLKIPIVSANMDTVTESE
ncbi:MAG: IMP dehydrogenase, partial [Patescibacteria group bacterium]